MVSGVQVVLGCIRKQSEQAMRSKPVGSIPPWPLPQFQFLDSCLEFPLTSLHDCGGLIKYGPP